MGKIQILDGETVNQIAAGEVVERPSSVVKELVENAIDAGATAITVEIADGGISLLRVTDNGSGMEKDDIRPAFLRHATSKIRSIEDLRTIASLGFRGEALSSIAAVAQVELLTKTAHSMTGCRYCIDGGEEKVFEEIGCPEGTTFIVRHLFYNTPARRKFLKSNTTEAGYVSSLIERLAMSHPDISFKYIQQKQNRLNTSGNGRLKDIIYHIYGRDIASQLLAVDEEDQEIRIQGYIGKPIICRGNRSFENYFINGRYIKSSIVTKAIEDAFKTYVMIHKFPFTVLHLTMDMERMDVNVHPTKMEVRFNNAEQVYQMVFDTLRKVLSQRELIVNATPDKEEKRQRPEVSRNIPEPFEKKKRLEQFIKTYSAPPEARQQREPAQKTAIGNSGSIRSDARRSALHADDTPSPIPDPISQKAVQYSLFPEEPEETGLLKEEARKEHHLIGQVFKTYWMVEYKDKLFIIDQHAAHEKVLYEKIMKRFRERKPDSQQLMPPIILTLTSAQENVFHQFSQTFEEMGFEIESFGGREYAVRGVPVELYGFDAKEMVIQVLDSLGDETHTLNYSMISDRIATMACKAAVKGNQSLTFAEADALIGELLEAENPYTCPHGRPTIIAMSKYELEKKFRRIQ